MADDNLRREVEIYRATKDKLRGIVLDGALRKERAAIEKQAHDINVDESTDKELLAETLANGEITEKQKEAAESRLELKIKVLRLKNNLWDRYNVSDFFTVGRIEFMEQCTLDSTSQIKSNLKESEKKLAVFCSVNQKDLRAVDLKVKLETQAVGVTKRSAN